MGLIVLFWGLPSAILILFVLSFFLYLFSKKRNPESIDSEIFNYLKTSSQGYLTSLIISLLIQITIGLNLFKLLSFFLFETLFVAICIVIFLGSIHFLYKAVKNTNKVNLINKINVTIQTF